MNSMTENDARSEYTKGLRALADLIDTNPDLPLPTGSTTVGEVCWNVWPHMAKDVPARIAELRRMLPGTFTKNDPGENDYQAKYYRLTTRLHGLILEIASYRDAVCERVITGTREVTELVPAPDAPMVEVTKTVEDVEWRCSPLLAEHTSGTESQELDAAGVTA